MKNLYSVGVLSVLIFWCGATLPASFSSALPNSVAAGDVTSTSVILWARSTNLGPTTFFCSTTGQFDPVVASSVTNVTDTSLPVKVELTGLNPGTSYHYRVTDSAGNSLVGRFRAPANTGEFHGLRFGVSGDWRGDLAPYPSVANAPSRDLDFFVALGDTIYADVPSLNVPLDQAKTLAEFRAKHSEVYSARFGLNALGDLRASTPVFAVIDDHEISNNFAGGALEGGQNAVLGNESILYRTALQAFHEYNPIREQVYQTPGDPRTHGKPKLYRTRRFGSDAAIFLLDARSFRDKELAEVRNPLNAEEIDAFNSLTFDLDPKTGAKLPRRTMLGAQQLADLKTDLLAAKSDGVLWKFVLVPEPIQNFGFADGQDRFEGYATERTELLKFIADNQIQNVVFVSADIHGTIVNNVNYQLGTGQPNIPTAAIEVVTGPVAYDKPFGPTVFDVAERIDVLPGLNLLQLVFRDINVANRAAFDALPLAEKDRLFKRVMDLQLTLLGLDPTGLEGSDARATLTEGNYVAVHSYGWTEFEIDKGAHKLTVTTYGIGPYAPSQATEAVLDRIPQIVSRFTVSPRMDPQTSPVLEAAQVANTVQLSWPKSATNFVLQSAATLDDITEWTDEGMAPSTVGERTIIVLKQSSANRFYRLKRR